MAVKYAFLIPNLAPGGVSRTVACLAEGLARKGVDVEVVLFVNHAEQLNELSPARIRVLLPWTSSYGIALISFPILLLMAAIQLRGCRASFISAHGLAAVFIVALLKRLKLIKSTCISFQHDSPSGHYHNSPGSRLKKLCLAWASWQFQHVIAVSEGVRFDLARFPRFNVGALRVLYNGQNIERIQHLAIEAPPSSFEALQGKYRAVICMVGRICEQKGFDTALRVASRLQGDGIAIAVVGDGPLLAQMQAHIRDHHIHNTFFLGRLENPYAVIARSDLFLVTSVHEAFGNVIVEALALGVPVVSTDCPSGPREILAGGEYGQLAPVGDDASLARLIREELEKLQHAEAKRRISERCKSRASCFDVSVQVDAYCRILNIAP